MKNLSKLLTATFIAASLFFAGNASAQTTQANRWQLGIGVDAGAVTGDVTNQRHLELGGTARLQYGTSNHFAVTFTSGYYDLIGITNPVTNIKYADVGIIPVKIGIKDFVAPNFYLGAEGGVGIVTNNSNGKFIASPAIGFADKTWDISARYENFFGSNNYGIVALRLGVGF